MNTISSPTLPKLFTDLKRELGQAGHLSGYVVADNTGFHVSPRLSQDRFLAFLGNPKISSQLRQSQKNAADALAKSISAQYGEGLGEKILTHIAKRTPDGEMRPISVSDLDRISAEIDRETHTHIRTLVHDYAQGFRPLLPEKNQEAIAQGVGQACRAIPNEYSFQKREEQILTLVHQHILLALAEEPLADTTIQKKAEEIGGSVLKSAALHQKENAFLKDNDLYRRALAIVMPPVLFQHLGAELSAIMGKLGGGAPILMTEPDFSRLSPEDQNHHLARAQAALRGVLEILLGSPERQDGEKHTPSLPEDFKILLKTLAENTKESSTIRGEDQETAEKKMKTALTHLLIHEGISQIISKNWHNGGSSQLSYLVNCVFDGRSPEDRGYPKALCDEVKKWKNAAQAMMQTLANTPSV